MVLLDGIQSEADFQEEQTESRACGKHVMEVL